MLFQTEPYILLNLSKVRFQLQQQWMAGNTHGNSWILYFIHSAGYWTNLRFPHFVSKGRKQNTRILMSWKCPETDTTFILKSIVDTSYETLLFHQKYMMVLQSALQCDCELQIEFLSSGSSLKYIQISFRYSAFSILTSSYILWASNYALKASTNCHNHASPPHCWFAMLEKIQPAMKISSVHFLRRNLLKLVKPVENTHKVSLVKTALRFYF